VDILHRNGKIVTARPEGFRWGSGEQEPAFSHAIISTAIDPNVLFDRYEIAAGKLVLKAEAEWLSTKQNKEVLLQKTLTDVLADKYTTLDELENAVLAAKVKAAPAEMKEL
jgi:hypothetical protein